MSHQVLEVLSDSKVYRNRKKVRSANSGEDYTIAIRKSDSRWTCSCKGWIFTYQKKGGDCGHIAEIKRLYGDGKRVEQIMERVKSLLSSLQAGLDSVAALGLWSRVKDEAEMLHLYFDNEGKHTEAATLSGLISDIREQIRRVAIV